VSGPGEPIEIFSPYCLVNIRAGSMFKDGASLQCVGLGCDGATVRFSCLRNCGS
jgi:hypothetical protein